ncbi:MAG: ribonucleotide-diphosphate reductase subunit alpha, partial [Pseudomonadota bacterium]|nr:ribonucleotide-diphosphate reductase subunit alpha [Pseudomonadota bacterium]
RSEYICQSQSINLFLPADIHKRDLHQLHLLAWKKGVKSLYYCRSKSIQRAEVVANNENGQMAVPNLGKVNGGDQPAERIDYEECLACQ